MDIDIWRKAIQDAMAKTDAEGMTTNELADAMGVAQKTAHIRLRRLIRSGMARHVGQKWVQSIDGRSIPVPAYRLVEEE